MKEGGEEMNKPVPFTTKKGRRIMIHQATAADADEMVSYLTELFAECKHLVTTSEEFNSSPKEQAEWLKQMERKNNHLVLVAKEEERIIGLLTFLPGNKKRTAHEGSFGMSVQKKYRGEGIGRILLITLINWLNEKRGIERISLEVFSQNERAIQLYKQLGFKIEGRKMNAIKFDDGSYDDLLLMAYFIAKK